MKEVFRHWYSSWRWHRFFSYRFVIQSIGLLITITTLLPLTLSPSHSLPPSPSPSPTLPSSFPSPQPHPLPAGLLTWQDSNQAGDYFDQVQPSLVGYLIWTQFPIRVYVQPPTDADNASPFTAKRAQTWVKAVQAAIQDWTPYLPLQLIEQATEANITIWRSTPPLRVDYGGDRSSPETANSRSRGKPALPTLRARSAATQFELYIRKTDTGSAESKSLLAHRMTIYIRPDQSFAYLQAAARHELGHALGIWGHSPNPTDTMYYSQVRNPARISVRDVNTLKRIYEQPTRLGWPMTNAQT
ncbi:matrixin family metalloprotease [Leptodesmis sp.]|uniref:matrixin family metalloprotease n=1 Tax=Leptodesmis sp. TaxID=3100501 RepID=UPI00405356F2